MSTHLPGVAKAGLILFNEPLSWLKCLLLIKPYDEARLEQRLVMVGQLEWVCLAMLDSAANLFSYTRSRENAQRLSQAEIRMGEIH